MTSAILAGQQALAMPYDARELAAAMARAGIPLNAATVLSTQHPSLSDLIAPTWHAIQWWQRAGRGVWTLSASLPYD